MRITHRHRALAMTLAAVVLTAGFTGCSRAESKDTATGQGPAEEVRVGYFPNVTHMPALIGVKKDFFQQELGATRLSAKVFNAGPDEVNALLGNSLDLAFIGSGPAINAFTKAKGAIQLVSGAVSGGAEFVVKPDITTPEQLAGKTIATPQLGNTQDVALKKWLAGKKLGDQVKVSNLDSPRTFDAFRKGELDGAWLPEPWASRLVQDAGARVLVDEKTLWPTGRFPSTVLIVRGEFLRQHANTVRALIKGAADAIDWVTANPAEAKTAVNDSLKELAGGALSPAVLDRSFRGVELSLDPVAAEFPQLAKDSVTAGIVKAAADLTGFADFGPLNDVLGAAGRPPVAAAGLTR